jgi:CheY-like chemotaxis protein
MINQATPRDTSDAVLEDRKCSHQILVVEDDEDIRDSLREALESDGYQVVTAEDGKKGLQALDEMPRPCLILLDLMMPVMNGWEFLEKMKEDTALATIPVVAVTAAGERGNAEQADMLIKKPVDLDHLLGVIKKYCAA